MARVTISDIASAVGVSNGAVSLALRNSPRISEARRFEIQEMAERLGYRKNPLVSALMATRARKGADNADEVIAWIVGKKKAGSLTGEKSPTQEVLRGIHDEAHLLGYRVEGFSVNEYIESGIDLRKSLVARGIRGVIIGPEKNDQRNFPFSLDEFSCIAVSKFYPKLLINRIMTDMFESTRIALSKMETTGIRRIGLICPDYVNVFSNELVSAAFALHNSKTPAANRIPSFVYNKLKREQIIRWFKKYKPQGILTYDPQTAEILRNTGVRIPDDLKVILLASEGVCISDLRYSACSTNPYAGGRLVVSTLADDLSMNRIGLPLLRKLILVEPKWVDGETL